MRINLNITVAIVFFSIRIGLGQSSVFSPFDCREKITESEEVALKAALVPLTDSIGTQLAATTTKISFDTANQWQTWASVPNFTFGKDRGSLPMITELNALHPYFRDKVRELIRLCKIKGIDLAIVETYRTHAKQNEYRGMGRKYTNSGGGKSKHQYGLAVDVVPMVDSAAVWDNVTLWRKIGTIGEGLGLRWGGRWKKPYDPGHFEWAGGLTADDLAKGISPVVPRCEESYPCLEEDLKFLKRYWREWEITQSSFTRK